ncbi:unnamed protein product [Rotaria magnacalcarata]|uniref:Peptidase S1 domain-containing protein n=3 Tax=Rotaria magnacalcarata TaxID=392030 RepID=A0A819CWX3_9BILA|nr:unnamed protein product [Rotaria magnacalcarata]
MKNCLLIALIISVTTDAQHSRCNDKLSCDCGSSKIEKTSRIINGEEGIPCSWPMLVSIRYDLLHIGSALKHICGGTIVSHSYILTAASCFDGITNDIKLANITIAAAMHNRSAPNQIIREVDQVIIHPNWNISTNRHQYDIALVHLSTPLDVETHHCITRTCLPPQLHLTEELLQYPSGDKQLVVVGWGRTNPNGNDSDVLRQALVLSIDYNNSKCNNIASKPNIQFCAGPSDASTGPCYGDFGGPILHWIGDRWEQVGIASYTPDACKGNSVIIYTRTAYYRSWIEENIKTDDKTTEEIIILPTLPPIIITDPPLTTYQCNKYEVPCGCGRRNVQFPKLDTIIESEAIPYSWSMIVSIRMNGSNKHSCSGSILTEYYILTSASCIANVPSFGITIVAGIHNYSEHDSTYRKIDQIFLHPNYMGVSDNYANDIAILHMSQPLDFDNDPFVSRTCVPEKSAPIFNSTTNPEHELDLALIGWGSMSCQNKTIQDLLQQVQIYSIDHTEKSCFILDKHRDIQFCAGVKAGSTGEKLIPCVGDSGSPIFEWLGDRWQQVGIASHTIDCTPLKNAGIYTRIVEYNDWIQSIINNCTIPSPSRATTTTVRMTTKPVKPSVEYRCNTTSTCGCGATPVAITSTRIVGGEDAREHSWSMIASLRLEFPHLHDCGGTILSNSYILTAAHCHIGPVSNPSVGFSVVVGMTHISDSEVIQRTVDRIYIHPNYIGPEDGYRHDIALLHINESLVFDPDRFLTKSCIHPVRSPTLNDEYIENNTPLTVIGWGNLHESWPPIMPTTLQQVVVYAMDNDDPICRGSINDSQIQFCAGLPEGGKDSCKGDSGGPIFQWTGQYWEQVGIVSYGNGCARPGRPGIYTRLSYYYDWINNILKNDNEHLEPVFPSDATTTMKINTTTIINKSTPSTKSDALNHDKSTIICAMLIIFLSFIL